jgi:hypothetical protein
VSKIIGMFPIYASGTFEIYKPDGWDDWTKEKQKEYFSENMASEGSVCYQCSDDLETDFELDITYFDEIKSEDFRVWEKQ